MPTYTCQCCQYTTDRKSSYDDHLTSKKHKKKMESVEPPAPVHIPVAVPVPPKAFDLETYLNVTCKDAMNFEYFIDEYLLHPEHQDRIMYTQKGDDVISLLTSIDYNNYPKANQLPVSFFCKTFNTLEHFQKPIFCSNVRDHKYHIKEQGKWSEISRDNLGKKIYNVVIKALTTAFFEVCKLSTKNFQMVYEREKSHWESSGKDELMIIIYGADIDDFKILLSSELSKLCNRRQVQYTCPPSHSWEEFKDNVIEINNYDSDSE